MGGTNSGTGNTHASLLSPAGPWGAVFRPAVSVLNAVKGLWPVPFTAGTIAGAAPDKPYTIQLHWASAVEHKVAL